MLAEGSLTRCQRQQLSAHWYGFRTIFRILTCRIKALSFLFLFLHLFRHGNMYVYASISVVVKCE